MKKLILLSVVFMILGSISASAQALGTYDGRIRYYSRVALSKTPFRTKLKIYHDVSIRTSGLGSGWIKMTFYVPPNFTAEVV
jgi:hypothetical protein